MGSAASGKKPSPALKTGDPKNIVPRLYNQLDRLLDDMEAADRDERMTFPQRIASMIALGRVMKMMQDLKKGELNAGAGSAVNKYAAAFQTTDAVGRPKRDAGPAYAGQPDPSDDGDDWDDAA